MLQHKFFKFQFIWSRIYVDIWFVLSLIENIWIQKQLNTLKFVIEKDFK